MPSRILHPSPSSPTRRRAPLRRWRLAVFALAALGTGASGQTNPVPQPLPFKQNFGTTTFSSPPAGVAVWNGLSGASISDASKAAAGNPTGDAVLAAATGSQTTGGAYGFAADNNGRCYLQTSSNATNGVCQLAIAVTTTDQSTVALDYDLEIINAQDRSIGVLCQYRLGTFGPWATLTPASGSNPFSQSGGIPGPAETVHIALPAAAADQALVQIRWAVWRGSESGSSSGLAIDNISVTGASISNTLHLTLDPTTIAETAGSGACTVTVTTASPASSDLPVTLGLSDPNAVAVESPNPAIIPAGSSSATFTLAALDNLAFDGSNPVSIQASTTGALPTAAILTITDDEDALSPPADHYAAAQGLAGQALKDALKLISSANAVQFSYSGTYAPLRAIHQDPDNSNNLIPVYSGTSIPKNSTYYSGQNPDTTWSREHVWPVSFGLDPEGVNPGYQDADAGPDYTDLFNLRPCLQSVNSERGNSYFDESSGTTTIHPLAPLCSQDADSWEPRDEEKGDLARIIFYMATRYDGTDANTIDLEADNSPAAAAGRFAKLTTLLLWHQLDPVSQRERQQNQLIFSTYQKNRNPFVDHPEYVALIFGTVPTGGGPAIVPTALPLAYGGPWSPLPAEGFLADGTGTYASSLGGDTGDGSLKFDGAGDRLTVAFSSTPGILTYQLKGNPGSGTTTIGTFQILESTDGESFATVRTVTDKSNADLAFSDPLSPATRFVSFLYLAKTSGNIQLDKLSISRSSPWQAWQTLHHLTGLAAAARADPDSDGLANLAEYALGLSPTTADPAAVSFLKSPESLTLTVVLRVTDPALSTTAESSPDLTSWSTSAIARSPAADQSGVPPGFERTVFEFPATTSPATFARLRFELGP